MRGNIFLLFYSDTGTMLNQFFSDKLLDDMQLDLQYWKHPSYWKNVLILEKNIPIWWKSAFLCVSYVYVDLFDKSSFASVNVNDKVPGLVLLRSDLSNSKSIIVLSYIHFGKQMNFLLLIILLRTNEDTSKI